MWLLGIRYAINHWTLGLSHLLFLSQLFSMSIEPATKADQEKMSIGLQRLAEEDPTFGLSTNEETGQTIIAGMGELHLEIIRDRLFREFKVEATAGKPQIAYRETITSSSEGLASSLDNQVVAANTVMRLLQLRLSKKEKV